MEYNTNRAKLNMPEYGRNLQLLVDYVVQIPEKEERNRAAETIVNMMASQNPQLRNQPEFMQKLWSHLFIMGDHKLDVDSPYLQSDYDKLKEDNRTKIHYPKKDFKYRFYGKNIELMIKRCIEMEDGEVKDQFKLTIASYMRLSYKLWNDDKVSDEIVLNHLRELSGGLVVVEKIPEHMKIYDPKPVAQKETKKFKSRGNYPRKNNNKNYRQKS